MYGRGTHGSGEQTEWDRMDYGGYLNENAVLWRISERECSIMCSDGFDGQCGF